MQTPSERVPWTGDAMSFAKAHVAAGILRVDAMGRVWRRFKWVQGNTAAGQYRPVKRRRGEVRAENVGGKGYLRVSLQRPDTNKLAMVMAHNLVYEVLVGPIPDGLELDHKNMNKMDNDPRNLEPVTQEINTQRSYANGRARPWSKSTMYRGRPRIDLDERLVSRAREMRSLGSRLRVIAVALGISKKSAARITGGKRGSHG